MHDSGCARVLMIHSIVSGKMGMKDARGARVARGYNNEFNFEKTLERFVTNWDLGKRASVPLSAKSLECECSQGIPWNRATMRDETEFEALATARVLSWRNISH